MTISTRFFIDPSAPSPLSEEEKARYTRTREELATLGWYDFHRLPEKPPVPCPSHFLLRTRGGVFTLLCGNESGQQGVVHAFEDPGGKTVEWWNRRLGQDPVRCVFHSLGLGYSVLPVLEGADRGSRFLIVESDPLTLSLCLALTDCQRLFRHPNITVRLVETPEEAAGCTKDWFSATQQAGPPQVRILVDPPTMLPRPTFARDWLGALARLLPQMADKMAKDIRGNYPQAPHLVENWAILQNRPGIRHLFGKMEGVPIVAIGAGPSLDEILPVLREVQDRVLLIVCDTAVGAVLRSGVRVDIALGVDSIPKSQEHFRGLVDRRFLPVFFGGVYTPLLQDFGDRAWITAVAPFPTGEMLEAPPGPNRYLMKKGQLVVNGSVGSGALDLAIRLGGSPIFLAGMDLGYCNGKDHASGTIYDSDGGFQDRQPALFEVPSVDGGRTGTCSAFLVSLLGMSHQIAGAGAKVFNLSKNGALIPGTGGQEEGLQALRNLANKTGEPPNKRFLAEVDLASRSLRRPLWRGESGNRGRKRLLVDDRGRVRGEPTPTALLEMARANLESLAATDSETARILGASLEVLETGQFSRRESCRWLLSEERYPRLVIRNAEGRAITILPTTDSPWQEIAEWEVGAESVNLPGVFVLGAGLGHHLKDLCRTLGDRNVWVWEPYPDRFRMTLGVADWRPLFEDHRFHWLIGTPPLETLQRIERDAPDFLHQCPVTWRPWVIPAFRGWASMDEREFVAAWLAYFSRLHPRPQKIEVRLLAGVS